MTISKTYKHCLLIPFIILFCLFYSEQGWANNSPEMRFSKISLEEGLSQSTVYDIVQDDLNNLWVATADGLNKYDGYRFTIYRNNARNSNSLQSNFVRSLKYIGNNKLIVGTKLGVSLYNIASNVFINFPLNDEVISITRKDDTHYYILTPHSIHCLDTEAEKIDFLYESGDLTFFSSNIYKEKLAVGSNIGLHFFENAQIQPCFLGINAMVQDIVEYQNKLCVATEGKGLFFYDEHGQQSHLMPTAGDGQGLLSPFVRDLEVDSYGRLWIGTMDGLSVYNPQKNNFYNYRYDPSRNNSIRHNSIRKIYKDNQNGMWLGTYFGGLNYYHPLQNQFGLITNIPYTNSLNDNVISCIVEGADQELWIGTNDKGVNHLDRRSGKYTYFSTSNGLLSNNIKAIILENGIAYVGSHGGGMSAINVKTKQVYTYTARNSALLSDNVYAFVKDNKGRIWVGTLNGLQIFDPQTKTFSSLSSLNAIGENPHNDIATLSERSIYSLYVDSRDRIWIGTEYGIYCYSQNNNLIKSYDLIDKGQRIRVYSFLEDVDGNMWIGMQSGLILLHDKDESFKLFTTEDGLPNNNVFGILQDDYKRLWISTNAGLASFYSDLEWVRHYTVKDGLQSNQFNVYSYCRTSTGEMFFGGINGINHFYPEQLIDNPYTPEPVISEIKVYNKAILPNDDTEILKFDISLTNKIELKANENSFSLLVTVPNYLSDKHNIFSYRLVGEDDDWITVQESNAITYSNLKAGSYKFEVKAGNGDGKWNNNPVTLNIVINPFWWESPWFRLIALSSLILFVVLGFRIYKNRLKMKSELELERLTQKSKEEINETKLRFFINISHEFRTPLSLILSPLKELLDKTTEKWSRKQLQLIIRNANKLNYLVDQLMNYRKADLGVFALKVVRGNVTEQINQLMQDFNLIVKRKNISFTFMNETISESVLYDPDYVNLILSNLLANSFKFTPEGGAITITTQLVDNEFVLSVSDTGIGLNETDMHRIFERFYQVNNDVKGTGIGLSLVKRLVEAHNGTIKVKSKLGEGTTFIISLPQDENIYSIDERKEGSPEMPTYGKLTDSNLELLMDDGEDLLEDVDLKDGDSDRRRTKLLIVEDDTDVRNYLVAGFADNAKIYIASNGKEAMEILKDEDIDLIITDWMMPIMDGLELCKVVKQNFRTSHIPVIMLTAKSNDEDEYEGLSVGADSYISKPFDISKLKLKFRNLLRARQSTLEHYSQSIDVDPDKIAFNELDREFLEKAKKIVLNNLDNISFSVDDFCKEMLMSRSNLHLKMKAITGESTIEFIKKIRFGEATKLLQEGRYSVSEISIMVGFNTASYFTTSFKKYFGILPSEYAINKKTINKTNL